METLKIQDNFNGYCYFNLEAYRKKDTTPCFISENSDEPLSWIEMFNEVLNTIKTKEFILTVAENYDKDIILQELEHILEAKIDFNNAYRDITNETPEQFAESFMDSYFLGGDEIWCSISTKLQDYMN